MFKFCLISFLIINYIKTEVACSEDKLIRELFEDIIDNGKLDCLRSSVIPDEAEESEKERIMRKAAECNSDCIFEASNEGSINWVDKLINNYPLKKGLVDVNGDSVEKDFEDQADMCEIIRALIANGKFPVVGEDIKSINLRVLDYIDCPGHESQTEVCAANAFSFANKKGWLIFLDGIAITINKEPKYIISTSK